MKSDQLFQKGEDIATEVDALKISHGMWGKTTPSCNSWGRQAARGQVASFNDLLFLATSSSVVLLVQKDL